MLFEVWHVQTSGSKDVGEVLINSVLCMLLKRSFAHGGGGLLEGSGGGNTPLNLLILYTPLHIYVYYTIRNAVIIVKGKKQVLIWWPLLRIQTGVLDPDPVLKDLEPSRDPGSDLTVITDTGEGIKFVSILYEILNLKPFPSLNYIIIKSFIYFGYIACIMQLTGIN